MTKFYFGDFTAIRTDDDVPTRKTPLQDECLFEARYLERVQARADFERGFIYDGADGRFVPITSWQVCQQGFEITSHNWRTRKISPSDWLYYSREVLDYLPIRA